jgi:uncharacterized protein
MIGFSHTEYQLGRLLLGTLPPGEDLITSVIAFCRNTGIEMATFTISGVLSSVTHGIYDPTQQVYVNQSEATSFEIISCTGNVSPKKNELFVYAKVLLGDINGRMLGGRLFSESIVFTADIELQELLGNPRPRLFDKKTGQQRWLVPPTTKALGHGHSGKDL